MSVARRGLKRSRRQRMLAGVCGGFAEWLGWNATLVRILFVLVSVLSAAFPGILVYLILWILMPLREPWEYDEWVDEPGAPAPFH